MRTKIVYILTSDESDTILEQVLISVYSLRKHNPDANVILVVDEDTNASLVDKRSQIIQYVNDIIQVSVPIEYSKIQRSRFIKTSLRELISGDFFYIDVDTVIIGDLSFVDYIQDDIAMAYDANTPYPIGNADSKGDSYINKYSQIMGWGSFKGQFHYNSGVVFAKDSDSARKLYKKWHELWFECCKCGVFIDELALTRANKEIGGIIHRLDDIFNWQIKRHGSDRPEGTLVLHYLTSDKQLSSFVLSQNDLHLQIKEKGLITNIVKYYLDNIDQAFENLTYVVTEEEYNLLQVAKNSPVMQINKIHPTIFWFLNASILAIRNFRASLSRCER